MIHSPLKWHGCYNSGWQGLIVNEAFAHPAKFAYGLICRIVDHGLRKGYWKRGDTIGDPFGGVALGGIICGGRGLNWIGVELEERFCSLGNQNLELHGPVFMASGASMVRLLQGDSREFARLVGKVDGVITSPPYADGCTRTGGSDPLSERTHRMGRTIGWREYGQTPGQISNLKLGEVDGVITSPPYEASNQDYVSGWKYIDRKKGVHQRKSVQEKADYGQTPGQIGNEKQETYWQAMRQVYQQMYLALKPGGVAAIVVKDYVKNKQRVSLCDDTCRLLESVGFTVFERVRAWLVTETREPGLFGEDIVTTKERKSFFRRLAERKGSPRIDWEEVIWCKK